jgi:hypothetical protein
MMTEADPASKHRIIKNIARTTDNVQHSSFVLVGIVVSDTGITGMFLQQILILTSSRIVRDDPQTGNSPYRDLTSAPRDVLGEPPSKRNLTRLKNSPYGNSQIQGSLQHGIHQDKLFTI